MGKIEKKLFRLGVRFLLAGLLAVVAVSAAALLILKSTSAHTGEEMARQAAAQCEKALTEAMQEQTLKYTEAFQDSIENRLLQSINMMDLTGAEIEQLYEDPGNYGGSTLGMHKRSRERESRCIGFCQKERRLRER